MQASDTYPFTRTLDLAGQPCSLQVAISNLFERKHGLEPRPLGWCANALPLSYLRVCQGSAVPFAGKGRTDCRKR